MDHVRIRTYGFPGAISELVARATAALPEIDGERGNEFLKGATDVVLSIFWVNYMAQFPEEEQREIFSLVDKGDAKAVEEWTKERGNIMQDEKAMQRANRVLAHLETVLPNLLRAEYARFQEATAVSSESSQD